MSLNSSSFPANAKWFVEQPRSRIFVNTNLDTGVDKIDANLKQTTLREAILYTQKHPGFYDIIFEKSDNSGVTHTSNDLGLPYWSIQLAKELPTISTGNIRFNFLEPKSVTLLPKNYSKKTVNGVVERDYQLVKNQGRYGSGSMIYIGQKDLCTISPEFSVNLIGGSPSRCKRPSGYNKDWIFMHPEASRWVADYPTVHFNRINFIKNNAVGGSSTLNAEPGSATGGAISVFSGDVLIQESVFQDLGVRSGEKGTGWPKTGHDAVHKGTWLGSLPSGNGQRGGTGGVWSTGLGSGGAGGSGGSGGFRESGSTDGSNGGKGGDGTLFSGNGNGGAGGGSAFTYDWIGVLTEQGSRGKHGGDGETGSLDRSYYRRGPSALGAAIFVHDLNQSSAHLKDDVIPAYNARLALSDVAFVDNKAHTPSGAQYSTHTLYMMNKKVNANYDLPRGSNNKRPSLYLDNVRIATRLSGDSYSAFRPVGNEGSRLDDADFYSHTFHNLELPASESLHFAVSSPKNSQHLHKPIDWNLIQNKEGIYETTYIKIEQPQSGIRSIVADQSALQSSINDLYKRALPDNSNSIEQKYNNAWLKFGGAKKAGSLATGVALTTVKGLKYFSEGASKTLMGYAGPFVQAGVGFAIESYLAKQEYKKATEENNARKKELQEKLSENREIGFEPINVLDEREVVHIKDFAIGEDQIVFQNLPNQLGSLTYKIGNLVDNSNQIVHVSFTSKDDDSSARRIAQIELSASSTQILNALNISFPSYFSKLAHTTKYPGEIVIGNFAKPYVINSEHATQFGPANNVLYVKRTKNDRNTFPLATNIGDDLIFGSDGNELIQSYAGDDQIMPGFGTDTVDGGLGTDLALFRRMPVAVKATSTGDIKVSNPKIFRTFPDSTLTSTSSAAPKVKSALLSQSRDHISIKFDQNLSPDLPVSRNFNILSDKKSFELASVSANGDQLNLSLTTPIPEKTDFAISYVDPSIDNDQSALQSLTGVDADGFAYAYSFNSENVNGEPGFSSVNLDTTLRGVEFIDLVGDSFVDLSLASTQSSSLGINGFKVNVGLGSKVIGSPYSDHLSFKFDVNSVHPDVCDVCTSSSVDGGDGEDILVFDLPSGSYYEYISQDGASGVISFSIPDLGQTNIQYSNIEKIVGLEGVKARKQFPSPADPGDQFSSPDIVPFDLNLTLPEAERDEDRAIGQPDINDFSRSFQRYWEEVGSSVVGEPTSPFQIKITADKDKEGWRINKKMTVEKAYSLLYSPEIGPNDTVEIWDYRYNKTPKKPIAIYKPADLSAERYNVVNSAALADVTYVYDIPMIHEQVAITAARRRAEQGYQEAVNEKTRKEQLEQTRLDEVGRQKSKLLASNCLNPSIQDVNAGSADTQTVIPFLSGSSISRLLSDAKPSYQYKNDFDQIFDVSRASSPSLRGFPKDLSIEFAASEDSYFDHKGLSLSKFQKQYDLNVNARGRFLAGSPSSDFLVAARLNSKIVGRNGDDILVGGPDNDAVKGGRGDDLIYGGRGKNRAFGGEGHDLFNLHSDGVMIIKDFNPIEDGIRFPYSMKPELLSFDVDRQSIYYDGALIARLVADSMLG